MAASRNPGPEQDPLFVVANQAGQIRPGYLTEPADVPAISLIEHDLHLQNVLTSIAGINMRRGFLSSEGIAEQFYGEDAQAVREGAQRNLENLTKTAKIEFARAVGHFAMIDAGEPRAEVKRYTQKRFSDFIKKYGGVRHRNEAHAYREFLTKRVEALQGVEVPPIEEPTSIPSPVGKELPELSIIERLEAIQ